MPILPCILGIVLAISGLTTSDAKTQTRTAPATWYRENADAQNTCRGLGSGATGVLKWKRDLNMNGPITTMLAPDGTIIAGFCGGSDRMLHCIDSATGQDRWKVGIPSMISRAPAVTGSGMLYMLDTIGAVYAFNLATNKQKWAVQTKDIGNKPPVVGSDGTVYVNPLDALIALDGNTGRIKWQFKCFSGYPGPALGFNGAIYLPSTKCVECVNPDGSEKWKGVINSDQVGTPSIGSDGTVYVQAVDKVVALNGETGEKRWQTPLAALTVFPPTIGKDGTIYVGAELGEITALDGATGAKKWSAKLDLGHNSLESSLVVDAAGVVYAATQDGMLYALDGATGAQKWEFDTHQMGKGGLNQPVIGPDGTICVSSTLTLLAIH